MDKLQDGADVEIVGENVELRFVRISKRCIALKRTVWESPIQLSIKSAEKLAKDILAELATL